MPFSGQQSQRRHLSLYFRAAAHHRRLCAYSGACGIAGWLTGVCVPRVPGILEQVVWCNVELGR